MTITFLSFFIPIHVAHYNIPSAVETKSPITGRIKANVIDSTIKTLDPQIINIHQSEDTSNHATSTVDNYSDYQNPVYVTATSDYSSFPTSSAKVRCCLLFIRHLLTINVVF